MPLPRTILNPTNHREVNTHMLPEEFQSALMDTLGLEDDDGGERTDLILSAVREVVAIANTAHTAHTSEDVSELRPGTVIRNRKGDALAKSEDGMWIECGYHRPDSFTDAEVLDRIGPEFTVF